MNPEQCKFADKPFIKSKLHYGRSTHRFNVTCIYNENKEFNFLVLSAYQTYYNGRAQLQEMTTSMSVQ